jgi:hypothetical protein
MIPNKETISVDGEQATSIRAIRERLQSYGVPGPTRERLLLKMQDSTFKVAAPYVERILKTFNEISKSGLEELPNASLRTILGQLDTVNNELNGLANHKPTDRGQNFPSQLKAVWERLFTETMPFIVAARVLSGQDSTETIEEMLKLKHSAANAEKTNAALQKILIDAQTAAGELGITKQAEHFQNLANHFAADSITWRNWLICAVAAGAVYSAILLIQAIWLPGDPSPSKLTQLIISKVLIASIIFFSIGWVARNYSACRHNYVTNRHRQTALSTFQTLVDGVKDDPQSRNAILVYACQAIFMPMPSGYGKGDVDVQQVTPVLELASAFKKPPA